jgi:hypothetical protein
MRPGLRFKVLSRDNYTCRYCGAKAPDVKLHVDHVIPKALGGRDRLDNLVTACEACNLGKQKLLTEQAGPDLSAEEYQARLDDLLYRVQNWFWHDLAYMDNEWTDYVGRRPNRREMAFLGELILAFGIDGVFRVMRAMANRLGYEGGHLCEHEGDEHNDDCNAFVEFDLFEIRQTLHRWRRDGFA